MNYWCKKWILETIPEMDEVFSAKQIGDRLHAKIGKTNFIENTSSIGMFLSTLDILTKIETPKGRNIYKRRN